MSARAAMALAICLAAGCAGEGGLRLVFRARGFEEGLDGFALDVVASQTLDVERAFTCRAVSETREAPDGETLGFPLVAIVHPGEIRWRCVGVHAEGLLDGAAVVRAEAAFCPDLDEVTEETIWLDEACREGGGPSCGVSEVCAVSEGEPRCQPSPVGSLFAVDPFVEEDCDGPP